MGIWYLLPDIEFTQPQYYAELDLKRLTIPFSNINMKYKKYLKVQEFDIYSPILNLLNPNTMLNWI